jgi:hypothetical protein
VTLHARIADFVRDEDAAFEALVLAEDESDGSRLEVRRQLSVTDADAEAGLDTYALAVESGAVHYGGVEAWRSTADEVEIDLSRPAEEALGVERHLTIHFDDHEAHEIAVEALDRLIGPPD